MSRAGRFVAASGTLACLFGLSCGGDDDSVEGGGDGGQDIEKVAMALTGGVAFENGAIVAALLPDPSNDTVQLDQASTTLRLQPGDAELLPLGVTNPESADTQVEAVLLQFEGADEHIEVTVEGSEDETETFQLPFSVDDGICDALCNEVVRLKLMQAVRMTDDSISEHLERLLELDCSDDGDPEACESDEPADEPANDPDGGTGSGGSTSARADAFASALITANTGLCTSCPELGGSPCDAIFPRASITCMKEAIAAATDAESVNGINGVTSTLNGVSSACAGCDMTTCPTSLLADELANLPMALADEILACADGALPPEAPAGM